MTAYFTPVLAMAMGIAFLCDGVTGLQWLGTAFIVGSAVIETSGSQQSAGSLEA